MIYSQQIRCTMQDAVGSASNTETVRKAGGLSDNKAEWARHSKHRVAKLKTIFTHVFVLIVMTNPTPLFQKAGKNNALLIFNPANMVLLRNKTNKRKEDNVKKTNGNQEL